MARASELLAVARAQLGVKEYPAGTNNVKYNTWFYGRAVHDTDTEKYPWCMVFDQWCCAQAVVALPARTASCTTLMNAAKKAGMWITSDYQPGDLPIFDWGGDKDPDHCGILERAVSGGYLCIEGNTAVGNDSNGGCVMERTREAKQILGAVRPQYDKEAADMDNTPSNAHKAGVEWAVANGILTGGTDGDLMLSQPVTRQQMCTMLLRMAKAVGKA